MDRGTDERHAVLAVVSPGDLGAGSPGDLGAGSPGDLGAGSSALLLQKSCQKASVPGGRALSVHIGSAPVAPPCCPHTTGADKHPHHLQAAQWDQDGELPKPGIQRTGV